MHPFVSICDEEISQKVKDESTSPQEKIDQMT